MQFKNIIVSTILLLLMAGPQTMAQQQRFPMPEFESGYQYPEVSVPGTRSLTHEYFNAGVLLVLLAFTSWLVIKKRSRRWILLLMIGALLYFGFWRNGCICPIGAVQNVSLGFADPSYLVSWFIIALFVLPLLFSLAFGRVFCGTACPLGAIQDIVVVRAVKVPVWVRKSLGMFPFIYLALAVLYATTGTDFIICRYDPFIGIFRMSGEFHLIVMGVGFLLVGMFVARPYCRFFCPYGALLKTTSIFSKHHLSITPSQCIDCKLCKDSCPFDAIDQPTSPKMVKAMKDKTRHFLFYAAIIPVLMLIGGLALSSAHIFLARANPDVYLAHLLISEPSVMEDQDNLDVQTFLGSDRTMDDLVQDAAVIQDTFRTGAWITGAFIGLVAGLFLVSRFVVRTRTGYQPNRGDCFSCGRCLKYCPVQK